MISIENIVLHELQVNECGEVSLHLNDGKAHCDVNVEHLVKRIHSVFIAKAGKGFGYFPDEWRDDDVASYALDHLVKGDMPFLPITTKLAEKLHQEFVKYPFADSGVLVFAEYLSLGTRYLLIGLVPKAHSLVASDDLKIAGVDYLDINHMTIAARIDVSDMANTKLGEEASYVSFMRSGGKRRMNDFFIEFLGINLATEAKVRNEVLYQALEDFICDSNVGEESRNMFERTAYAYCDGQIKIKDDISLKELSDAISDEFDQSFQSYVEENGYELDECFQGDRASLRRLVKIAGSGGGISMSFDARLLNERVFYDVETDTLTLKGTPPAMRDLMLRKSKANGESGNA
ncbi:nucleoid-associated protein [Vibrio sp. OPT18]|uniref:nucleoid-associated protein n=1 Tax=Vibrio sp. OPT18 TaxID=2778641 RepID=UPI0018808FDA|nr:nucleoid-associated protein [Vibrio sp. OPT18]MBE8578616.1 nucleoid-associated protein [Vibrio sp. OPT18]